MQTPFCVKFYVTSYIQGNNYRGGLIRLCSDCLVVSTSLQKKPNLGLSPTGVYASELEFCWVLILSGQQGITVDTGVYILRRAYVLPG